MRVHPPSLWRHGPLKQRGGVGRSPLLQGQLELTLTLRFLVVLEQ